MITYIIRRLILLPITLFFIILVNFVIINLAPGEPSTLTEISPEGMATRKESSSASAGDERYLQFREFYGLTLPILWNSWPWITLEQVEHDLWVLVHRKASPEETEELPAKDYNARRIRFGDQARFVMPHLLHIIEDPKLDMDTRKMAVQFFIRGGSRQAYLGPNLTEEQKNYNRKIAIDNNQLRSMALTPTDSPDLVQAKIDELKKWYQNNAAYYQFVPTASQKINVFFFQTRFFRYISRVMTLDFGTLRNDDNKTVLNEVTKRFKYSLTLSIIPMVITFGLCQIFGMIMAYYQNGWPDLSLNLVFLILYAIPIFVVAPFLIEMIALNHTFPFTDIPIPLSGFTSSDTIYNQQTSMERLLDVLRHIFLPIIAVMYGTLAAQARLSRTAVLEVMRMDYVRTAWAKGLAPLNIMVKHVGRNAGITIITSLASSLGIILGGSLIVETLFEINGFGKFFYDAIINRDYNVIMFSALAGSFLTLVGYLIADIAYTLLDPRLTLE